MTNAFVEAPAVLEIWEHSFRWRIVECPLCGGRHLHGGGEIGKDDPRRQLGHHASHCRIHESPGYLVTDAAPGQTRRILRELRAS